MNILPKKRYVNYVCVLALVIYNSAASESVVTFHTQRSRFSGVCLNMYYYDSITFRVRVRL